MRSIHTLVTFLIGICPSWAQSVPSIEWYGMYGGADDDYFGDLIRTETAPWVVVGGSRSVDGIAAGNHGNTDVLLFQLDGSGLTDWHQTIGGTGWEGGVGVVNHMQGGYAIVGTTNSIDGDAAGPGRGRQDVWVVRTNAAGEIEWQRKYGSQYNDVAAAIATTSDGGILFTAGIGGLDSAGNPVEGGDIEPGMGTGGFWLLRLNGSGDILWQNRFGGSSSDIPYAMALTQDKGCILVGATASSDGDVTFHYPGSFMDGWVLKVDSLGQLQWQKTLGGTGWDILSTVVPTREGGYVVAGYTESNDGDVSGNHGGADGWVVKLDTEGSLEWQRTLGGTGNDQFNSVVLTADGGFALAGFTNSTNGDVSYSLGGGDGWVVKLDSLGNLQWDLSLGGSGSDFLRKIRQTEDGGFLVAGDSDSNDGHATGNHGGKDIWVVRLGPDPSGILAHAWNVGPALAAYPNPARDALELQYTLSSAGQVRLDVFNAGGQQVLPTRATLATPGTRQWTLDLGQLPPGVYQLRLATPEGVARKGVVRVP